MAQVCDKGSVHRGRRKKLAGEPVGDLLAAELPVVISSLEVLHHSERENLKNHRAQHERFKMMFVRDPIQGRLHLRRLLPGTTHSSSAFL